MSYSLSLLTSRLQEKITLKSSSTMLKVKKRREKEVEEAEE
jgi:hypothetical protein